MITHLLAPNPGPMTLSGTNTWLVGEPGRVVIVDPGPDDEDHRRAIVDAAGGASMIIATHRHHDHTDGIAALAEILRCPVRTVDPSFCRDADPLADGEVINSSGVEVRVVATPGHTDDSVCLVVHAVGALLSGDTMLGQGTSVIAHPDGNLTDYLASLDKIRAVLADEHLRRILPGHGPEITDPIGVVEEYRRHRLTRLQQVQDARAAGAATAEEIVSVVYEGLDPALVPAALQSVRAQLAHLD
ncbi:MAG: MBL fold metallo-hydrolase [Propionibacteriales bacterium]|nr:MBL fold metallo-hydrolase [Propionibacteriales bacterium]